MCTIMTFDRATFVANKEAILATIQTDGTNNPHGWNLILAGERSDEAMFLQAMKISWITSALTTEGFSRFWLHARRSTTNVQGLSGCHGFRSYTGWFVQHNGILHSGRADKLPVDSMVISELLEYMTPQHVSQWLLAKENYANVFMINPENGEYHVVRCSQGTLYSDTHGNYSSSRIAGVCENSVPNEFHSRHVFPVTSVPKYSYGTGTGGYHSNNWDDSEWYGSWHKGGSGRGSANKSSSPNKETKETTTSSILASITPSKGKDKDKDKDKDKAVDKKEVTIYTKYHTMLDSQLVGLIATMPNHDLLMEYHLRAWASSDTTLLNECTDDQLSMLITFEQNCKVIEGYRESKILNTKYSTMGNDMLEACYVKYGWVDSIPGEFWQNATPEQRKFVGSLFSGDSKRREARSKAIASTVPATAAVN